jgi:ribosomal protein L7/L12
VTALPGVRDSPAAPTPAVHGQRVDVNVDGASRRHGSLAYDCWVTEVRVIRCPACGAAVTDHSGRCGYCQALLANVPPETELWDVRLDAFPRLRIVDVIKAIRQVTGLGLREAKDIAMGAPTLVACGRDKERADAICEVLRGAGAASSMSPCFGNHRL